ncbi:hypothetical protein L479_02011 [Exiguobacterium sp. S17]|nr:hypothetical protein L479_02011 [Exiguobacterium sp. S17]
MAALIGGIAIGFFIARKYMMNYLEQNPPINEDMIRTLMMQMGQKTVTEKSQPSDACHERSSEERKKS